MNTLPKDFPVTGELANRAQWPEHTIPFSLQDLAEKRFWPEGFRAGTASAGIKTDKPDLMVIVSDKPSTAAAVFTRNLCSAAPVSVSKKHLERSASSIRAIVCNSGNANAATGNRGLEDAKSMADKTAGVLGADPHEVLVSSTGVIGVPLPVDRISNALDAFSGGKLESTGKEAAEAIMTTDTFPKFQALDVSLSFGKVRLCGIAKGAGMICPDMATMLAFLVTDAKIGQPLLREMLQKANRKSFNTITVDGDTSTNDMAAILSNGSIGEEIAPETKDAELFYSALESLMTFLARLIVKDGEGATKLVAIHVEGAESVSDAQKVARTVAGSSLVKTALHGEDANWGRILAAAGRSGAVFNPETVSIKFNDLIILEPGYVSDFSEEAAKRVLSLSEYSITVSLGKGNGAATVHTCDLSKEYIDINGSYRT